ncbi:mucin TcMUCII [Trypanosoma cruzi]|nr:mucin TcMUCII [Trypanosoma cruzi]
MCVRAVRASTQSRGHVRFHCVPMYKVIVIMMVVFALFASTALLFAPRCSRIRLVERITDTLICMRTGALGVFILAVLSFFKLVVCRAVFEYCNRTGSICFNACAAAVVAATCYCTVALLGFLTFFPFYFCSALTCC